MMRGTNWLVALALGLMTAACVEQESQTLINRGGLDSDRSFNWNIPANYPLPVVHAENPISEEKLQLGRHLFYDLRLSGPANFSCASCHRQELAFTDGLAQAIGATGQTHPRSAQALVNIAYNASVNWGNPSTVTLEQQAPIPLFNEFPN
ncbi:MAG: cytochrome c peroxidase [Thiolinea sp.]